MSDFVNWGLKFLYQGTSLLASHHTSLFNVLSKVNNNVNSTRRAVLLVSQHLGDELLMILCLHS